jgi:hypothetical protein
MSPRFALSTLRAMTAICLSALLVGCLEKEGETRIKDVEDKMDGQRFDIARANEFLIVEKAKLAGFEQAALDLTEAKGLTESLSEMKAVLEAAQTRN